MKDLKRGSKKDLKEFVKAIENGITISTIKKELSNYSGKELSKLSDKLTEKIAKVEANFMFSPFEDICIKYSDLTLLNSVIKDIEK